MKKLIIILFISISIIPIYAQVQLPVNIVWQEDPNNWCWAASITSIAQYYGQQKVLRDVLETARLLNTAKFGTVDCHSEPCPLCHQGNVMLGASGSATISEVLTQLGLPNSAAGGYYPVNYSLRSPLTLDQVKWNINAGRPVLATWQNKNNASGHAVVIKGYSGTLITYMNPLNTNSYDVEEFDSFVESPSKYWYGTAQLTTNPPCNLTPYITGPTTVCSTSDYTFTVNNFCPGSNISWSVLSGQLQKVSSTVNTAVFRGLTGASGPGTIQAAVTLPSGQVSNVPYSVWVGTPSISNVTGPRYTQVGASTSYCATITDAGAKVTSYNWSLMPGTFNNYFNPGGLNCYITWYRAGEYVLQVNAQNSECGTGTTYYYPVTVGLSGYLSLSPNPASGNVQASVKKVRDISTTSDSTSVTTSKLVTSTNQDLASTYTVRIYNGFGTLLYSTKKSGNEFTIPVNNLPDGTYIIEANDGKESYKQQLMVKH